jgi:hypothetical protein
MPNAFAAVAQFWTGYCTNEAATLLFLMNMWTHGDNGELPT